MSLNSYNKDQYFAKYIPRFLPVEGGTGREVGDGLLGVRAAVDPGIYLPGYLPHQSARQLASLAMNKSNVLIVIRFYCSTVSCIIYI